MFKNTSISKSIRLIFALLCTAAFIAGICIIGPRMLSAAVSGTADQQKDIVLDGEALIQIAETKLENQQMITESLLRELESDGYSFENPLIVTDPYGESPLTALLLFTTQQPCRIRVEIPGEDSDLAFSHSFPEMNTRHQIPVYGLYPDTENTVKLQMLSEDGKVLKENQVSIQTEPLTDDLKEYMILTESYGEGYSEGLNFDYVLKIGYDRIGTIRWYLSDTSTFNNQVIEPEYLNNHFLVTSVSPEDDSVVFYELDLLGRIYNIYWSAYDCHHDVAALPNGNLLVTGNFGQTIEDVLYEIDIQTGKTIHMLDFKTVLQQSRQIPGPCAVLDWMHMNSVDYDPSDNTVIVSSNQQGTVAKVSWPSGEIKWLLGDPTGYMPRLRQHLLTPVGEGFEYSYNHHDASILPDYDNDPNTLDILLFDNGYARFLMDKDLQRQIQAGEATAPENYSRLVHYRIDEANMTVEQIWQYGKERGEELYSNTRGSAQRMPNGNTVGCFFKYQRIPVGNRVPEAEKQRFVSENLVEVNSTGELIWDAEIIKPVGSEFQNYYRSMRLPIYYEDSHQFDLSAECTSKIP